MARSILGDVVNANPLGDQEQATGIDMKAKSFFGIAAIAIVCFLAGNFTGFLLGIWSTEAGSDFLEDALSDEQPANVSQSRQLVRDAFRVDYPGNWQIDSADEDYDPDHLFSIDSPGSSFAMFLVLDVPSEPATNVEEQVRQFSKLFNNSAESRFTNWGKYSGEGVHLQGRIFGMKSGVRIFSSSSSSRSIIVVQQCVDEDLADVEPGFDLIERTFELID
jgi:hypothetical protein